MFLIFSLLVGYIVWKSVTADYPDDDFLPTLKRLLKDSRRLLEVLVKLPVGLFVSLLCFFTRRVVVSDRTMNDAVAHLKMDLKDNKGFERVDEIPDSVWLSIVHEALRRAAEKEKDGRARTGEFFKQIDAVAGYVVSAFEGKEDVDSRIKNILVFNRML